MPTEDRSILERSRPEPAASWSYGPAPDQVADVYLPAGPAASAVVLLIHGGFWRPEYDRGHLRPMAAALAAAGHPTVLVEYRREPGDPDAGPTDIRRAVQAIGSAVDTAPGVVLVGHSAGGHLALVVAAGAGRPVIGCLALAPVADLALAELLDLDGGAVRDYLGGPAADRGDLDPSRLPRPEVPVTVLHGDRDSVVPVAVGRAYCEQRSAHIVRIADCGHFEPIDPLSAAWPTVIAELTALIARSGIE